MNSQEIVSVDYCHGIDSIFSAAELTTRLQEGKPLTVKAGFDPTAPDIHLGHSVIIRKLRQFQQAGHNVSIIIGDFTALLGDPSGRSKTRPQLTETEVGQNAATYLKQLFKILDARQTVVYYNSQWLKDLTAEKLVRLASATTVARMLERDDFQKRYLGKQAISLHEFLYPLFQAYDSVKLQADVEIGGTDQIFNLLLARKLMESYGFRPQVCITMPLLEGTDGVLKMSKSLGNYIGIAENPDEIFGKVMSIPDALLPKYYRLLTDKEVADEHPRKLKFDLATQIVAQFHDEEAALNAGEKFERLFVRKDLPDEILEFKTTLASPIWLPRLLVDVGFAPSTSKGRRLIEQGAVKIDSSTMKLEQYPPAAEFILQCGKRKFVKIVSWGND